MLTLALGQHILVRKIYIPDQTSQLATSLGISALPTPQPKARAVPLHKAITLLLPQSEPTKWCCRCDSTAIPIVVAIISQKKLHYPYKSQESMFKID
jgi:hypothetical protein